MPISNLNRNVIEAAIVGFEQQKMQIDDQIAELRQMLDGGPTETTTTPVATAPGPGRNRKKFSAATIRRMREAQQRRWSKIRGESKAPATTAAELLMPKRKLSAAAKAILVANLEKARAAKAAKAKSAATKKASPVRKKSAVKKAAAKKTAAAQASATA
jgi:hypothetical protein